ncbi:MAG: hypothetical protein IT373_10790 [Polyangiaceae bacterium]|nr:hypothetical protein [Polyangiaceae bacterium]
MTGRRRCLALAVALAACASERAEPASGTSTAAQSSAPAPAPPPPPERRASRPWPALPTSPAELAALVAAETRRPPGPVRGLDAPGLLAALRSGVARGSVAAGYPAIAEALGAKVAAARAAGRPSYLLFGAHHDSGGQVEAFRRLVGALGVRPAPLVAVELFRADGGWGGAPDEAGRGDDAALAAFLAHGDLDALETLRRAQLRHDYTAFKYGYVERVLDLAIELRAAGRQLVGCDMPAALQARARPALAGGVDALRDLHCALALERALGRRGGAPDEPEIVALFYGDAHLAPDRLPRHLPARAELLAVHLVGERHGDTGVEAGLGGLELTEPLLVPLGAAGGAEEHALVLPGGRLAARHERVRERAAPAAEPHLAASGSVGVLHLAGARVPLDGAPHEVPVRPGRAVFLLEVGARLVAGALEVPAGGSAAVDLELDGTVRLTERSPEP